MPKSETIARMVRYSGRVQGVGFRHAASSIARHHRLNGWVRNLPDGRVQLFVEGPSEQIEKSVQAIKNYWGDNITHEEVETAAVCGLTEFSVRR